jgi:hypothetical protein
MSSHTRNPSAAPQTKDKPQDFRPIGIQSVAAAAEIMKPKVKAEPARAMPPGVKAEWH